VTRSGQLAKAVARHRPSIPIVAFCYTAEVGRSLALQRAVTPILLDAGAENPYEKGTSVAVHKSNGRAASMASTPSMRRQLDGVAVWSLIVRFSQHGRGRASDSLIVLRTGRWVSCGRNPLEHAASSAT
jgi:hypothetical protein